MAAKISSTVVRGTESPKNTTSGLSTPPQDSQAGTLISLIISSGTSASPSGASAPGLGSVWLCRNNALLHASAFALLAAAKTHHAVEPAMEVDNLLRSGTLVQAVYILGNQ